MESNKTQYERGDTLVDNSGIKNTNQEQFRKIPYTLNYNYLDSLGTKINPYKNYDYWQYATYYQGCGEQKIIYTVLKQGGDISLRKKINENINPLKISGIFQGGHPSYRCNYAIYIQNKKIHYVKTEEEFRNFLGEIDNLEEALLLARTYGYLIGSERKSSEYRKTDNGFELHLMRFYDYPPSKELIDIEIKKDGFVKTKSLGIYKTGREAYE
ncbi:hypothetical protein OX284_010985 [Flavobacterium sp. SUN046]|uniref:hypothetical protein n=1 Tax=Flavobacterium sp. SUN046 TaxID=3002440 RepID=UPI002DBA3D18|nr:hypothetical protein [Flavobacterium sp. SUN046]MEC4049955.1 hypothetical protein [Flavobacterium sp. SUN046]